MDFKYQYLDETLEYHHELNQHPCTTNFFFHVDPWCEIYGFLSGDCYFRVEGTKYVLNEPSILILGQGEAHCIEFFSQSPYEREVVHFSLSVLKEIDADGFLAEPFFSRPLGQGNLISVDREKAKQFWYYMNAMHSTSTDPKIQRLTLLANLFPLLYEIRLEYQRLQSNITCYEEQDLIGNVVKYINFHLHEPLTVESIAKAFYLSQSQLNRIFHKKIGSSVYQYIQLKRLIEARLMLKAGRTPGDVARACGYSDYSCFYKAYRKNFGTSPYDDIKGTRHSIVQPPF